jgi:hypothetical protein
MNPFYPLAAVIKAVTFPFKAIFVVGLCYFINWFTSPGEWWANWVLFGMVIATVCVWFRALRAVIETVGIAGGIYLLYRWWNGRSNRSVDSRTIDAGHS